MMSIELLNDAESLLAAARANGIMLATAESCTGGLITATLTAIAGSSDVVDRGFVTYSDQSKTEILGVPVGLLNAVGAVSESVARLMAQGALNRSRAHIAVSVTGVAGPGGGSADKPVGTVYFGVAQRGRPLHAEHRVFPGDRAAIREATVATAFGLIRARL